jgi:hypothetical protein
MVDNVITAYSGPLHTNHELITPNQVTPYIGATSDLRKGPVVLEVPVKTDKGVLYGQVVDAWQATIADVGPSGLDKGARVESTCFCPLATSNRFPTDTFQSSRAAITYSSRSARFHWEARQTPKPKLTVKR